MTTRVPFHALARAAGVHDETLRRHRRDGCPPPPSSQRGVAAWVRAYAAWRAARDDKAPPPGGGDSRTPGEVKWSERGAQARALSTMFDLQVKQGRYVLREIVDEQRTRQVTAVIAAHASMARRAGSIFGAEVQAWIEREHRAICDGFADDRDDDDERDEAARAATEATADVPSDLDSETA